MPCKDCIHYGVCKGVALDTDDYININADMCKDFKDKSKIIELPCKIGDTVYIITPVPHILTRKFAGIHISTVKSRTGKRIDYIVVTNELGSERYDMRKIGKIIFFDKAEAENKLKGGKIWETT